MMYWKKMAGVIIAAVLCAALAGGCSEPPAPEKTKKKSTASENNAERIIGDNNSVFKDEKDTTEKHNILIAIDPGHQSFEVDMSAQEPNAPGSGEMKAKASSGTTGKYSKVPEYQLALDISLMLREELEHRGYDVLLTREDNETAISNSERAVLANESGADISVRIHANGSEDSSVSGALALIPSQDNPYVGGLWEKSQNLADCVLGSYCESTGMPNKGVTTNDTMTGINWSEIPVMILEMGFMSNEQDDLNMQQAEYRNQMVKGIVDGIDRYYGFNSSASKLEDLESQLQALTSPKEAEGEKWSIYVKRLSDGASAQTGEGSMQSASLIKLFTAACVYENFEAVKSQENSDGETEELLHRMIAASDNEAANALVLRLGQGDALSGMEAVNSYCADKGYGETHMGRLMLDFEASDDNFTTPADCGKLLETLYNGQIAGAGEIIESMKAQERRAKIPAGVPSGIITANKTGELDTVENDAAIIYNGENAYIVCVMAEQLNDAGSAREKIKEVSGVVYTYMNKQ